MKNEKWIGWRYPGRHHLDFWKNHSPGFESLKNPRKREAFMKEVTDEIESFVIKFIEVANENSL